jgi:trigger factor
VKFTTQELGNREVELKIEVDAERLDRAMRQAARRYAREINIPGFRPGRAPYNVVVQRVGEDRLLQDALDQLAPEIYEEALVETDLDPFELQPLQVADYDPLTLSATIPLMPRVELGDYHTIEVDIPAADVSAAEVEAILREYQEENAQLVPVDRGAELGDQVIVDLQIDVDDQVVYNRDNISFVLSPAGLTGVPAGFFDELVGLEPGEVREFELTYPEDFDDDELAGKSGTFRVELHETKERELPELDDELAQTVGDFATLDALRERTREMLSQRAKIEAENELAEAVVAQVLDMATVEYPPVALEREIDQLVAELESRLQDQGLTLDNYVVMQGVTMEGLRDERREEAEYRLRRAVVLGDVVGRENIAVDDGEIDSEIEVLANMYGTRVAEARQHFSSPEYRRSIRNRLLTRKAIDRLVEIATGTEPAAEPASPDAEAEPDVVPGADDRPTDATSATTN